VFTTQRDAVSEVAHAILASLPSQPADVPVSDASVTSAVAIKVSYARPVSPDDGGSPIVSYELQMDDGEGGGFVSLRGFSSYSLETDATVTVGILKGRAHRLRYRAKNAVGWGPFSEEATILAATVPAPPAPPVFAGFSAGALSVVVGASTDNGGTAILAVELWRDQGDDF
jgi:hypothetical protein